MLQAYVVIECEPGKPKWVARELEGLNSHGCVSVVSVDAVMGPWDAIVKLEGPDVDSIETFVVNVIGRLNGIAQTQTMMSIQAA